MTTMRHRIDWQRDISEDGDVDPNYDTFIRNMPCNIVPVRGMEKYRGRQLMSETSYVIETRYYQEILDTSLVCVNSVSGTLYTINSAIDVDGRQRFMMIQATEEA